MNYTFFNSQTNYGTGEDREPAFAEQFYSASQSELTSQLTGFFEDARANISDNNKVRAIIAPHAGYVFSGAVAASAFNQIPENADYKRVFVIASSHRYSFKGASVYTSGNYLTPLGEVQVDCDLTKQLVNSNDVFLEKPEAHKNEHSLEVQLPFLQHKLGNNFLLVPIILGINTTADAKKVANVLKSYFTHENLFVISTDFSHYPGFEDAKMIDNITADAICANEPKILIDILEENKRKKIDNLSTSLCGWTSVLTLLYLTEHIGVNYHKVEYRNSGHARYYGQKDSVVGYWAISITENDDALKISKKEKEDLISLASKSIIRYLTEKEQSDIPSSGIGDILNKKAGAFVSVYVKGDLRGCIGNFGADKMLSEVIRSSAVSACKDLRFERIKPDEIDKIDIEISVLSPLKKINSVNEIELGKHGIYIRKGLNTGTFLPQVAKKTGWNLDEFLGHCARDKADIGWDGWKNAELFIYEAVVFRGKLKR